MPYVDLTDFFESKNYDILCQVLHEDMEEEAGCMLTEEMLTEGKFSDKYKWWCLKSSLRFLDDDTIDTIIEARYADGEERVNQPRKAKIKMLKKIADELPEHVRWKIIHGHDAEILDDQIEKASIGVGAGAAGLSLVGIAGAAGLAATALGGPILWALGAGALTAAGISAAVVKAKHKKAMALRRNQIVAVMMDKLNLTKQYTHNQDDTISFGGMMRKVNAMYVANPTDAMLYEENGYIFVETAPFEVKRILAEEFIVKDIRQKILTEAAPQFDPVEVLTLMGVNALRPYNGMPFNKFIIANLIPGQDMDAVMGESGDYKVLISACLGDDEIQYIFKEIKKELKMEEPNKNALIKLKNDLSNRILYIAQRLAPQSQQIQESVDMMQESFLAVTGAVALGGLAAVVITKAFGSLARWIRNRKKDKNYAKEQQTAAAHGENHSSISGDGTLTITINDTTGDVSHLRRSATDPDLPIYRNGTKITIDDFLKKLAPVYRMIETEEEGLWLERDGDEEDCAITLYAPEEIRRTFFEYEFDKGVNRYYQIGEDDRGDIVCFCPQAAEQLYIVDIEDMVLVKDIKGLKKFRLQGGGIDPRFAIGTIRKLDYKKMLMYDPALDKDVEVKL